MDFTSKRDKWVAVPVSGRLDWLLQHPPQAPMTSTNSRIAEYIDEFMTIARIRKKIRLHGFRHTFATMAKSAGIPKDDIRRILGQSSESTTNIYLHVSEEDVASAKAKLDALSLHDKPMAMEEDGDA